MHATNLESVTVRVIDSNDVEKDFEPVRKLLRLRKQSSVLFIRLKDLT